MKIKLTKKALSVILAGTVIIYGASKVGKIIYKDSSDSKNITQNQTQSDNNNNLPPEYADVEQLTTTPTDEVRENNKIEEKPIIENVNGLDIETTKMVTANATVNIRSTPSIDGKKISTLNEGNSLPLINQENSDWYKVKCNEEEAYISTKYSSITEQKQIKNDIQKLVCFTKDSKLYENMQLNKQLIDIPALEAASVYKEEPDSYLISLNNMVGYVPKKDTEVLDGTFVIVDISDQMAYLYEDNTQIISTPVVTGKPSTPTTKGLHKIWDISTNRYLKGPGYKVYVDYMMAFHNGEGLHDSEYHKHYNSNGTVAFSHGWRGSTSYGGSIYKTNGSHGCVNMPYEPTKIMYENLKLGDKVLVKE